MSETIKLTDEGADRLMESIENPPEPSELLKEAKRLYKQSVNQPKKCHECGRFVSRDEQQTEGDL